jgi:hypothetical protein
MAVHEAGHVINALTSGGKPRQVELPLIGFSRTDVEPNPSPCFVAWGGPVWGAVIPTLLMLALTRVRRARSLTMWFAGFCLVCNGAYLLAGTVIRSGDTRELIRLGTPPIICALIGGVMLAAGLFVWHIATARSGVRA